jgi:hypothetical protein
MREGDPIVELVDIAGLNLHMVVYGKDISRIQKGQQVEFTTEARDKIYHGVIQAKGKAIETGLRKDGFVEILSHENLLSKNIVVAGAYYLNAEMTIEE